MAILEQVRGDTYGDTPQNYLWDWARRSGNVANLANYFVETKQDGSTGFVTLYVRDIADKTVTSSTDRANPVTANFSLNDVLVALECRIVAGVGSSGSSGGAAVALRFAAAENRYPVATFITLTTKLTFFVRRTVHIGSSDLSGVVVSLGSTLLAGTAEINAGAYNITSMAFEKISGTPQFQPLLFSGGRTKTINAGDSDIQTDVLLPAAFGLTAFTRGDTYAIRIMGTVAAAGVTLPAMESVYAGQVTDYDISYDPASGTGTAGATGFVVDATGAPTPTLSTFTFMSTAKFCCQLLGYMPPTAHVTVGVGDSIVSGKNNTETTGFIGFYGRTLLGPDGNTATAVLAGCNFGLSGSTSSVWTTTPKARSLFKYANIMVEEFGTNGAQTAGQMTICQGLWSSFKAAAPAGTVSKVVRTMLLAETTSTDTWMTDVNQTKVANWTPGGTVDLWNQSLVTQNAGTPGFDALVDFQAITKGTGGDRYLWVNNGTANYATTDGTHPSPVICTSMAVQLRAAIDAL